MDLVSEVVKHDRDAVSGQQESRNVHPLFYTMRVTTNLTTRAGQSMLAGVHTPSEEFHALKEGRPLDGEKRIMVFVRALALPSTTPDQLKALWQTKNSPENP